MVIRAIHQAIHLISGHLVIAIRARPARETVAGVAVDTIHAGTIVTVDAIAIINIIVTIGSVVAGITVAGITSGCGLACSMVTVHSVAEVNRYVAIVAGIARITVAVIVRATALTATVVTIHSSTGIVPADDADVFLIGFAPIVPVGVERAFEDVVFVSITVQRHERGFQVWKGGVTSKAHVLALIPVQCHFVSKLTTDHVGVVPTKLPGTDGSPAIVGVVVTDSALVVPVTSFQHYVSLLRHTLVAIVASPSRIAVTVVAVYFVHTVTIVTVHTNAIIDIIFTIISIVAGVAIAVVATVCVHTVTIITVHSITIVTRRRAASYSKVLFFSSTSPVGARIFALEQIVFIPVAVDSPHEGVEGRQGRIATEAHVFAHAKACWWSASQLCTDDLCVLLIKHAVFADGPPLAVVA